MNIIDSFFIDLNNSRLWSLNDNQLLAKVVVPQPVRSAAISTDAVHIAVGLQDGSFLILKARYKP